MAWKSFLWRSGVKNARSIREISSLVVHVSPQNGAQEARECTRRRMLETRQRDTRKENQRGWRELEKRETERPGIALKGSVTRERRREGGWVRSSWRSPSRSANNAPYRLHNERGYQGHAHVRPLAVLVIMSTQIMRGDWCSIYLPSGKGTRKNERVVTRGTRWIQNERAFKDEPFWIYRRSTTTTTTSRTSRLDGGTNDGHFIDKSVQRGDLFFHPK